jgi:ribose 5-phosphate isomerase RpiB
MAKVTAQQIKNALSKDVKQQYSDWAQTDIDSATLTEFCKGVADTVNENDGDIEDAVFIAEDQVNQLQKQK